jgi:potassium channel subfamily K
MSSISLVILSAIVAGPLKQASPYDYALTQAYYYAVFSAVLYFIVATMMVVTVFGFYNGHYDEEFKLTVRRRSLMVQTSGFMIYLLSGAAVYTHVEDWKYLDAVYWADYTILTVGLGEYAPKTHLGRSLLFPFATGGIIIFGLVICTVRSLVVDRGKLKMGTALVEKLRQGVIKELGKKTKGGALESAGNTWTEFQWSRQEFELMRRIQHRAISRRRWTSLLVSAFAWFVLWFVSASVFKATEKSQSWSYFDSLYFTFTSLLTIGYGDFYPTSSAGKAYFVFWSLLAVPTLTILISNMGDTVVKKIGDVLLCAGNFTIFAPEGSFKTVLRRATKRKVFEDDTQETYSQNTDDPSPPCRESQGANPKSSARPVHTSIATAQEEWKETKPELSMENRKELHCFLIQEIHTVMEDVNSSPPRKYTFEEWSWYLNLLSANEPGSHPHRKSLGMPKVDAQSLATAMAGGIGNERQGERNENWSWIGDQSPLMADMGEPEWLLSRLITMLERELESVKREGSEHNNFDITRI